MDKRTCTIDGCEGKPVGRGWCSAHWQRWRRNGDPLGGAAGPRVRKSLDFPDGTRQCAMCGERKPLTEAFDRDANSSGGRRSRCKTCRGAHMKRYYAENREAKRASAREWYATNLEEIRERDRARYERDREKRIDLAIDGVHRRRQRIKNSSPDRGITRRSLRAIHGDDCRYCGVTMTFETARKGHFLPDLATIEHLTPLSKGGSHTFENTCLACWSCNIRRGNREVAAEEGAVVGDHSRLYGAPSLDQAAS